MTNRLAAAQSLYLRKHTENPIDWYPWGAEALETAKREDKPIFLSVGYSSCHWCTVMEGEAFSDASIAAFLNINFLSIKVYLPSHSNHRTAPYPGTKSSDRPPQKSPH